MVLHFEYSSSMYQAFNLKCNIPIIDEYIDRASTLLGLDAWMIWMTKQS